MLIMQLIIITLKYELNQMIFKRNWISGIRLLCAMQLVLGVFNVGYRIRSDPKNRISENFGSGKLRSESDPKFSDIRTFRIGSPGFRIGYRVFESDYRVFGSGPLKFLKNPDPYPIRKPEIFSGYPIRNIQNLKIGSDIRNFGSDRRIFGSDISDQIFLHTPSWCESTITCNGRFFPQNLEEF